MAFGVNYQIDYFCGWRFLFSENYREQVKNKWGGNLMMQSFCLIGGFIGMLITSAAAVLLLQLVYFLITSNS